jgi:NADPH:quinone reductase-like Zn-dependent oxidoreductase
VKWDNDHACNETRSIQRLQGFEAGGHSQTAISEGRAVIRITAAGVTPLEHTILSGGYQRAKAPVVLGGEGAGVVEERGGTAFPVGSRVMFTGPYGVSENGTYSEWLSVRSENLCLIPENIPDVSAAGIPVAYLTAQMALSLAGFVKGKTVLSPAIGGSVGNAVTQLARAQGAKHAISTTTNHAKAQQARYLGFDEVIDLSEEKLSDGVRRITKGYGVDIVIDAIGGEILSEALSTLATRRKPDNIGLLRGSQDNHRRHGSNLEACEYEELLPVRTTCRDMGHRMERYFFVTSLRRGQADCGKDFPPR